MNKNLYFEVYDHSENLLLWEQDTKKSIDFRDNWEKIASTFSGFKLYEIEDTDDYVEEEELKKDLIAQVNGRFFDIVYANNNGISLEDIFDEPDGDSASLIEYLLDEDGDIKGEFYSVYTNVYYLDRIEVLEKHRGKGYAKFILKNLQEILMYLQKLSVGIIIIQAQPFERVDGTTKMIRDDKARMERLIKLYEECGFTRIGKSNYLISIYE